MSAAIAICRPDGGVKTLSEIEAEYLLTVVHAAEGNLTAAARLMGLHRRTLQRKLTRYARKRKRRKGRAWKR